MAGEQLSEEELKNMSPEEIMELQKKNCIFCKLISGEIPGKKVYEDDQCVALLDINPASDGHMLLMPKQHINIMPQIPPELLGHLMSVAKALSHVLLKAVGAKGTEVFIANGQAAGQRAPHFMIHVFSRSEGDGVPIIPQNDVDPEKRKQIISILQEKLGLPPPEAEQQPAPENEEPVPAVEEPKEEPVEEEPSEEVEEEDTGDVSEEEEDSEEETQEDPEDQDDDEEQEEAEQESAPKADLDKIGALFS